MRDWVDFYVDETFAPVDPCVLHAGGAPHAASWSELRTGHRSAPASRRVLDETTAHGWRQGLAIPVRGPRGYRGIVGIAGEARELPRHHRAALVLAGLTLHHRLLALHSPERVPASDAARLSVREIDCICWLLAGKSDWEIDEILCIAEATAHWRIERAKEKLGVRTRAQLTALAVHHGLVWP